MSDAPTVALHAPPGTGPTLFAYLVRSILTRAMTQPEPAATARALRGTFALRVGRAPLRLVFGGESIEVHDGEGPSDASMSADMRTLIDVCLGRALVRPVLTLKLRVGGRFWRLLPLLRLFRVR